MKKRPIHRLLASNNQWKGSVINEGKIETVKYNIFYCILHTSKYIPMNVYVYFFWSGLGYRGFTIYDMDNATETKVVAGGSDISVENQLLDWCDIPRDVKLHCHEMVKNTKFVLFLTIHNRYVKNVNLIPIFSTLYTFVYNSYFNV